MAGGTEHSGEPSRDGEAASFEMAGEGGVARKIDEDGAEAGAGDDLVEQIVEEVGGGGVVGGDDGADVGSETAGTCEAEGEEISGGMNSAKDGVGFGGESL